MSLLVVGLNHRSAPVAVLERAALSTDEQVKTLHELVSGSVISEAMMLSTCNRVEVYVETATFHGGVVEISEVLARVSGVPFESLRDHLYVHHEARAVSHLFEVACGLDSVVIGEAQILGQVRAGVATARAAGTLGRSLGDAARAALRVGKRARAETDIDAAGRSVVALGMDLAARRLGGLQGRRAVIIGAGATGALAAASLSRAGVAQVSIANRTAGRARRLTAAMGEPGSPQWEAVTLEQLPESLASADLVVSSTAATGIVLAAGTVADAMSLRPDRPLVVLDLALPRDIDPAVTAIPGVMLIDLDVLRQEGALTSDEDVSEVRALVDAAVTDFLDTLRAGAVAPTVVALREQAARIVGDELGRLGSRLPDLDGRTRAEVEQTVRRVVDKLLHAPTVRVKELARSPGGDTYAAALQELFDLPREAVASVSSAGETP